MNKWRQIFVGLMGVGVLCAPPAWSAWEIAPFVGGKLGGSLSLVNSTYDRFEFANSPSFGLAVGADVSDEGAVEVLWSHQNTTLMGHPAAGGALVDVTDMGIDQFMLNGLYLMRPGRFRPFILGGLGVTRWNPYGNFDSLTRFSWALGGGVKYFMTQRWGVRLDARWVPTVVQSDSSVFCESNGGAQCQVTSTGTLLDQFEFTGSVVLRFGTVPQGGTHEDF